MAAARQRGRRRAISPGTLRCPSGWPVATSSVKADPHSVPGAVDLDCGIQLRGSIDLVERHPSGFVRVTDHKTGKADGKPDQLVDGGKSLQPVLYALAAEKLLRREAKGRRADGSISALPPAALPSTSFRSMSQRVEPPIEVAETIIGEAIGRPFLPAAPDKGQCEWCDYRVVCGPYEEQRTARKPEENLEPLLQLRGLP